MSETIAFEVSAVLVVTTAIWVVIMVLHFVGGHMIRRECDYYPSYKWLKQIVSTVGTFAVVARLTGINGTIVYQVGFLGFLLVGSLVEFLHILRRNSDPYYLVVKTRRGLARIKTESEARLIVSEACGIVRHHIMDTRRPLDDQSIAELRDSLGLPSASEEEARLRRQITERRERMAQDGIFADEVNLLRRELEGDREFQ